MIRDFIYYVPMLLVIVGGFSMVLAANNRDREINEFLIIFNIINIIYLFVISMLMHNLLPIIVDMRILFIWFISAIGGVLFFISLIIGFCNRKKLNNNSVNKSTLRVLKIILGSPIILLVIVFAKELYLINNSSFLLAYEAHGNYGIGDYYDFVYAISDKYCKEIGIDVKYSYMDYRLFLPKKLKEITEEELHELGYEVEIEKGTYDNYLNIYKNDKLIYKELLDDNYSGIELEGIYYNGR